jgi:hypothetical protein
MQRDAVETINATLIEHLSKQPESAFTESRRSFLETGFGLASYILPEEIKKRLSDEIQWLISTQSVRRDLAIKETSSTARRMRNVTAAEVRRNGHWIAELYESEVFRSALSRVAGEPVLECPYLPEQYIITRLEQSGDTHGWHWDDYSFGVIFIVECPPVEGGGFVQCVSGTSWDKEKPEVFRKLIDNPIRSHELRPGDLYILRTDTTLHQVHPILEGTRTIVNFAFAAERDLAKNLSHETMDTLFET